jgi:hypothetical protein
MVSLSGALISVMQRDPLPLDVATARLRPSGRSLGAGRLLGARRR